ncbi:bacterioferritin [Kiloniella laminariae]|uniref:Bacterioferritin n=1 Tax=Kiloniella laminariae TaxID=454162 RepID=A0ABT4LDT3_9PROT|nr:bacterioferritin [Kiloniella laminariae]MCZ4279260.1 bacterioferritin [Kiloniella laminariae]
MKGDKKVIEHLNIALTHELTAINQYFLHSKLLNDWGVKALGKHEYKESIEEMHHADKLIDRILLLDGFPNLQSLNKLKIGEDVEEILKADLAGELEAVEVYKAGIKHCESVQDYGSRDLLKQILVDEEEHVDYLESQFELIKRIGIQNYVQSQSGLPDSD